MFKKFKHALTVYVLLSLPIIVNSQAPDLGATASFAMFTAAGAFSNDGNTVVTGDIGTNVGAFTGFPPGIVIGAIHVADAISAQAATDVGTAYSDLVGLNCGMVLGTTLGGGQILTPNTYCLGAASVLNGDLVLDGECDPNALFIFQIDGALSTAVNSTVTLTNGASLCNVYWQVNGAVSLGEGSVFRGTIIAGGAITLLEAASLEGRGLTTAGQIEMHNNVVNNDMQPEPSILTADGPVIFCLGDSVVLSGNCGGTWSTGSTSESITVSASGNYFVTTSNACGNATSNQITVTVNPLPDCTISGVFGICFGQTTVICTPAGYTSYAWNTGATTNCITVSVTGTYSVTVTDVNGCTSVCSQAVISSDVVPPQIFCPIDITIDCSASSLPANTGFATATDACDPSPTVDYVDLVTGGACAQAFTITRTWTATDEAGNTASCAQTINGSDVTSPSITCPVVISPVECGSPISFGTATVSDVCDPSVTLTFEDVIVPGSCIQEYTVTRTWTAEDDCGNTATCSSSILVEDTTAPLISCPGDVNAICDISTDPATTGTATAVDNCDGEPVITYADVLIEGNCPIILNRTWTATDDCGNTATCIQTIEVTDNTPPQIVCAVAISPIECGAVLNFGVPVVTDECDPLVDVTFITDSIAGACGQEYTLTRTWTAVDGCGNTATCSSTIVTQDNTAPEITCPIVVSPIECGSTPSFGTPTAIDACDALVDITFSDVSVAGLCAQEYSVTRTWIATDDCGNTATCSVIILVQDNTPPVITCPNVINLIECGSTPVFGTATAIDACDAAVDLTFSDVTLPGACLLDYSVTRTWTAEDDCGNVSTCSVTISVEDNTPPVIICPVVISPIECGSTPAFGVATAIDACDALVSITFSDITVQGVCPQEYTMTRTWIAADDCGNTSSCSATILVQDNTAPIISCPVVISPIECGTTPAFGTATAVDACDASVTVTFMDVIVPGLCAQESSITRTWIATDDCGNTASCSSIILIQDNTPPIITCPIVTSPVECGSPLSFGSPIVTDACDAEVDITFTEVTIPGLCPQASTVTRTWIATDDCGNSATCSSTIQFQDNTAPIITCPVVISPIECGAAPSFGTATAIDACDAIVAVTFTDVSIPGLCGQELSITRTWIATDDCGNTSSCSATIFVQDNTPPVITCPVVVSPIECGSTPSFGTPTALDACDILVDVTFLDITTAGLCPQESSVTRTWTAVDDCGNTSSCSSTIVIQDNTAPIITCPTVVSPITCGSIPDFGNATAIDACDASVSITFTETTTQGICVQEYTVTRTWIATDDCGNTASCSRTIEVGGSTGLLITCPPAVTVQCADQVPVVDITLVQASGNCGTLIVTHLGDVITNQTCLNNFTLTRTYVAADLCGNSASCNQIITVLDNTPPQIILNPDLGQIGDTLRVQCYGQDPEWDIPTFDNNNVTATDLCGGEITTTYTHTLQDQGDCSADGYINLYKLTWTTTDICGNSSSAFVFLALVDTIPPVIHDVPDDITVNCEDLPWPATVYATDECLCACIVLFQETDRIVQNCQNGLVVIRSWTATDRCGNVTVETQRITLIDQEGPALVIMQSELVGLTNDTIIEFTCNEGGIPSYFDMLNAEAVFSAPSCGGTAVISFTENSNTVTNCEFYGYVEQRTYTWKAVDPCGNETTLTITVRLIDNEAPVITGVPEMTCIGDPSLNNVDAIDNCEHPSVRFWDVSIPNPCGAGTALRRTYEAFDNCGNMARDTVILMPDSGTLPVLTFVDTAMINMEAQAPMNINCAAHGQQYTAFGIDDVAVVGGCTFGTTVRFVETLLSTGDCISNGFVAKVELKWIATDMCGNRSEKVLIVNIVDESSPVFLQFSPELFVGCHDSIPLMTATDNCGDVTMSMEDMIIPGTCVYEYDIVRTYTATDPCNNATVRRQLIHVGNGGGPSIEGVVEQLCDDLTIPVVTAYDGCAEQFVDVTMEQDTLDVTCQDGLVIQRTWSATDACGNTTVIFQTIILHDLTPPELYVPSYSVIYPFLDVDHNLVYESQKEIMDALNDLDEESVSVYDDCDQVIIPVLTVDTLFALDCEQLGYAERRTYTWLATDICGNTSSISFTIDIMDDLPPVFRKIDLDTTIICAPLPSPESVFMVDSLEAVTIVYTEVITPGSVIGQWLVTRTWVATDSCHNATTTIQHILWQPESTLECSIIIPDVVECNSHGVIINSSVIGGTSPYEYEWRIVGEKCFLQAGQGTPDIVIYMGWADVTILLTVTDSFGCVSVCTVVLHCTEQPNAQLSSGDGNSVDATFTESPVSFEPNGVTSEPGTDLTKLNLWPNPATESVNVSFESSLDGLVEYSFTNFLGQTLLKDKLEVRRGYNARQIDAAVLPNGSYMMQIKSDKAIYTKILIILRNG